MTFRPAPERACPGALFVEFHPPLTTPGVYRVALDWRDESARHFEFELPFPPTSEVDTRDCDAQG